MLTRLANIGIRYPKRVLAVAGLFLVLAAAYGAQAASHLASGGFYDTKAESGIALNTLTNTFHAGDPNLILEVSSPAGIDSSATRTAGLTIVDDLQHQRFVSQVLSYWTAPAAQATGLRSHDGTAGLIAVRVVGNDNEAPKRAYNMYKAYLGTHNGITVKAGGNVATVHTVNDLTTSDLAKSEAIAIPITVIVLIWIFGSFIASLLPLVVGISSIVGTMAMLRGLGRLTDVSIYALNMTTAMGLALAIDYSLFIVSRYREEIRNGVSSDDAIRTTMQTAGRTVLFSALTVGLSLAAMLVFPMYFLRSFGYAGIGVVALATVAALILLPAMLKVLGPRVDALDLRAFVRRRLGRPAPRAKALEETFWYRFANAVMRRALPIGLVVTAILVALGLPFLHANFGFPDDRVVPKTESAHEVGDDLRNNFTSNAGSTISIVVPSTSSAPNAIGTYAAALSKVANVTSVSAVSGTYVGGQEAGPGDPHKAIGDKTYLDVQTSADAQSDKAKQTLSQLRAVQAPWQVQFTGQTAINSDSLHSLGAAMPIAIALIALATFLILFLFTGSLILPLKALVLNTLSLSATFGAMVWIFQDGHLASLYGNLTTTGDLNATMPPLMFCVAFGLSMDYEVFLLSRIREAWLDSDHTAEANTRAVAIGLGRTGRIVTAAALLMAIVFAAIADARVSFMMLFGTGLTLAVLMDATIVRGILVPAFMKLAGRWNWWAPRPLARLHERFGLAEGPHVTLDERETVTV